MRRWFEILKGTVSEWQEDEVPQRAASLAYYTLLSTAPLSLICVAIVGFFFGDEAARGQVAEQITAATGPEAAQAIQQVIVNAHDSKSGVFSTLAGLMLLLVGASGVFGELQTALNKIWDVKPKPGRGVKGFVHDRFLTFTMVLGVGFVLLASLALSAGLSAVGKVFAGLLPGGEAAWQVVNFVLSFGVISALFALIFKYVPDAVTGWRYVWVGGAATAFLFTVGKLALGLYLGKSTVASAYGAAGSVVAFMVWIYYASQILFLGAEFTQLYARTMGKPIQPSTNAVAADAVATPDAAPTAQLKTAPSER